MLVLVKASGRGKASGIEVSESTRGGANLFRIRDGMVVRLDAYFDRDRAPADLGLAQESDSG